MWAQGLSGARVSGSSSSSFTVWLQGSDKSLPLPSGAGSAVQMRRGHIWGDSSSPAAAPQRFPSALIVHGAVPLQLQPFSHAVFACALGLV